MRHFRSDDCRHNLWCLPWTQIGLVLVMVVMLGCGCIEVWEKKQVPLWLAAEFHVLVGAMIYATYRVGKPPKKP